MHEIILFNMHSADRRKYDLTIGADNVMVQVRPPALVTLFLTLMRDEKVARWIKSV